MIRRLVLAADDRLGSSHFLKAALRKAFPDHWSFMLGEIALYCFIFLILSGTFLGFFFDASGAHVRYQGSYEALHGAEVSAAYASVIRLSLETRTGLLIRQAHHWAALIFVAAIAVHMCRVFFTGAFRRPREINWVVGLTLLLLALGAGFTGYSLPDDLLSGTGLRIAYSVLLSVPFVGGYLAFMFFGGNFPAAQTSSRLFITHILFLPALLAAAMTIHLAIIWRQKHSQFRGPGRTEHNVVGSPLWPNYALKSIGLMFAVFAVMIGLGAFFEINPIWSYGPYYPANVSSPAQPDWYIGWLEGALRLGPNWELHVFNHTVPSPFWAGVLVPLFFFSLLYLWPFIERRITHDGDAHQLLDHPSDVPARTAVGAAVLSFAIILTFAGADDVMAKLFSIPLERLVAIFQVLVLVLPAVVGLLAFEIAREVRARRQALRNAESRIIYARTEAGGFAQRPEPEADK
ncbi:MAG: cytochrome bc complex cytochrome b subunit [Candidatus Eremiobacteraeota bacterium]|nr:cytochrome bc complex cytochrome b subunit [Candidatus Eremiobacteraeota bacterium]